MDRTQLQKNLLQSLVISVDGPAGSGKSTTARLTSERLRLKYIDTGAMYRAITLKALESNVDLENGERLGALASTSSITLERNAEGEMKILLEGRDVTLDIRTPEVTRSVSLVSAYLSVRKALVRKQRSMAEEGGVVLDGRDIGSVVVPHADVKVYIDASLETRASRRLLELEEKGIETTLESVKEDMEKRDRYDSSRAASPLKSPVGAYTIDTTGLTIEEQVQQVVSLAEERAQELAALVLLEEDGPTDVERIRPLYRFGQKFLVFLLRFLWGIRIERKETKRYNENYIFACNHVSYSDPPLVGSTLPREVFFLAKEGLFRNRLFARLIRTFNAIPLKRSGFDRKAMRSVLSLLDAGKSVLIFPEGGRIRSGKLGRPMSGIGYLALNSGIPVVPLYVKGSNRLLDCFLRRRRLVVKHGKPLRLTVKDIDIQSKREDHDAYSEMVMAAIQALKDEADGLDDGTCEGFERGFASWRSEGGGSSHMP